MSPELIRIVPGRPAVVVQDGVTTYIAVHDAYFLREKRAWKKRLAHAHPDHRIERLGKGRAMTGCGFRRLHRQYEGWLREERAWFRRVHLPLPGECDLKPTATAAERRPRERLTLGAELID